MIESVAGEKGCATAIPLAGVDGVAYHLTVAFLENMERQNGAGIKNRIGQGEQRDGFKRCRWPVRVFHEGLNYVIIARIIALFDTAHERFYLAARLHQRC